MQALRRINASIEGVIIGSGNGLALNVRQIIARTNATITTNVYKIGKFESKYQKII